MIWGLPLFLEPSICESKPNFELTKPSLLRPSGKKDTHSPNLGSEKLRDLRYIQGSEA